jgi:PIN domain nuclease of toxin-antitoxin system
MGINYLLDTHILLWWFFNDPKLDDPCREIIRPIDHRDPFDRMIMAQADIENFPVITSDQAFQTGLIQVIFPAKY